MTADDLLDRPLFARISNCPVPSDASAARARLTDFKQAIEESGLSKSAAHTLTQSGVESLLLGILGCSPYLSGLIQRDASRVLRLLDAPPRVDLRDQIGRLTESMHAAATLDEAMRYLRQFKNEVALLIALCDLGGLWSVPEVTAALTSAADSATAAAVRFLFRQANTKGDIQITHADAPETGSGYIVIAMGKHGAHELNYSSDIDLIVFFEPGRAMLKANLEPLAFFVRLTRDLVKLLQERTADGYVFRTDLRLRPDPGSTQVAISTPAALNYYESFGQNWERAAMIKARVIAGDIDTGVAFLKELAPFIWRKYLDFAAIADIHAMKRQIHAFRGFGEIGVAGHNIKLGRGGIREIEFFVQTQQLIAGGRQPDLRSPSTLVSLERLKERNWITSEVASDLKQSYVYLRGIEHRLQMLADEQTQTLPTSEEDLARLAHFSGYQSIVEFSTELLFHLDRVQRHYAALFENVPELTRSGANMVFAGEADDPGTVEALSKMGYERPSDVIAAVRGWHHGRYPAIRSPRARELLTEVQPLLIEALGRTADPDLAFHGFDRFLSELPSGVQLFSLLRANPSLLQLVSDIMGSAPRLARTLGRHRNLLDAVLDPGFFGRLPDRSALAALAMREVSEAVDLQEALDRARVIGSEQNFLTGVRVLTGTISATQAGDSYSSIAECLVQALQARVEADLAQLHGIVPGGAAAVVAMGKLGGQEMTAASDLDLIVIYDFDPAIVQSNGPRPLAPSQYYARFTQRLISALTVPTAQGALYEVDMRLRPSGQKGPVATQLASFIEYQANAAWTWEHLALTRARVISGPSALRARIEETVRGTLLKPRDRSQIATDVKAMRDLIAKEKGTIDIWDLKQVRGGLVDLEFMAQHLQLVHASRHPSVLHQSTVNAFLSLSEAGCLSRAHADTLIPAARLLNALTQILRLCLDGPFQPDKAPDGLKSLLARAGEVPDFERLEASLKQSLADCACLFDDIVV